MTPLFEASSSSRRFDAYRDEFYRANLVWDSDKKIYYPNSHFNLNAIQEAFRRNVGLPLLLQISRDLFFGTETIPKVAALAYAVLDLAIELGCQQAERLLDSHQSRGFGCSNREELVVTHPDAYWENGRCYNENWHFMSPTSNSNWVDFLSAASNVLALDRRIKNLRLSLLTRLRTPDEYGPLGGLIETIQLSPYLEGLSIARLSFSGSLEENLFIHQLGMIVGTPESESAETAVVRTKNKIEQLIFSFENNDGNNDLALFLSCMKGLASNTTLKFLTLVNQTRERVPTIPQDFKNEARFVVTSLHQNLTLTTFCLNYFQRFPNELFQSFSQGLYLNKTLETLNFEETDLGLVESCSIFAKALLVHPSLRSVNFKSTGFRFSETILQSLSKIAIPLSLLADSESTDYEIKLHNFFSSSPSMLTESTLFSTEIVVSTHCKVTDLDLSSLQASDAAGKALAAMLRVNTTLVSLKINGNRFTNDTVIEIAQSLTQNETMESFEFDRLSNLPSPSRDFFKELANLVYLNGSLTHCKYYIPIATDGLSRNIERKRMMNISMLTRLLERLERTNFTAESRTAPASSDT